MSVIVALIEGTTLIKSIMNAHVLVVEDEPLIALDVEAICLESGAATVTIARTVAELDTMDLQKFDIAILDRNLGIDTSHGIARRLDAQGTPFVFTSGFADENELAEFPHAPLVQKPYSTNQILEAIAAALRNPSGVA